MNDVNTDHRPDIAVIITIGSVAIENSFIILVRAMNRSRLSYLIIEIWKTGSNVCSISLFDFFGETPARGNTFE